jgi:3-methyladenine DNA glycosylase AlkD
MNKLKKSLIQRANKSHAANLQRFFKTGKGEYGEGDIFMGLNVPAVRTVVREFKESKLEELQKSIESPYHEERLAVLLILVEKFKRAEDTEKEKVVSFYLQNLKYINNWDLVDLSADKILGAYLEDKNKKILFELSSSESLWERRISVMSTFHFIKTGKFDVALKIISLLLNDAHDLIHKASGWMLREIGKRDINTAEKFLKQNCKLMPRTMLRYAIEKFPEAKRISYLKGGIN